ncbi:MAG TPA: hypothetical protein VLL97_06200 [Acidobacteriota bacterium]|nr:hypothetical protein [Acidobacteriota bacterium]
MTMSATEARQREISDALAQKLTGWDAPVELDAVVQALIKQGGFTNTLKWLKKGWLPAPGMMTVREGVLEEQPSGLYDAALQTDHGRVVLRGARRTDRESTDPQSTSRSTATSDANADTDPVTPERLLFRLTNAGANVPADLIFEVELTRFEAGQHCRLLPLLWQYILRHRDSKAPLELAAAGAATRKYVALMPMEQMGQLAVLLESGHRLPPPIELEIEIAKMIYRNFEVHPPVHPDPQPELAQRLWEMVQAYTNPRILLRDKHSAAASLSIAAIVAMRSPLAEPAWRTAVACPYRWFAELVDDSLALLRERWNQKHPSAVAWLAALQGKVTRI